MIHVIYKRLEGAAVDGFCISNMLSTRVCSPGCPDRYDRYLVQGSLAYSPTIGLVFEPGRALPLSPFERPLSCLSSLHSEILFSCSK